MATEKSALRSVIDRLVRRFLPDFGHEVTAEDPDLAFLKDLAFKDEVTGLYNRRFFSIRLEEEVSRYRRFVETSKVGAQLYADRIRHVLSSNEFAHRCRMTASFAITSLP